MVKEVGDLRSVVVSELERLEEDMLYTEKGHFAAAEELKAVHTCLGLVATVCAAAAAASIVADNSPVLSGTLALVAAMASAMLTFVKPQETAAQHLSAARALGATRILARQHREIDLHPDAAEDPAVWRNFITVIATAKKDADSASPSISNRRFEKGRRKIKAGHFEHGSPTGLPSSVKNSPPDKKNP
ncbi:SLATT domain-containing protein [Mycolicibacterium mengxianglii]|uniref:SLATT domain-containing protein n=1 Tax=Mycolicibacterium mengxianglii TaxID=2736649 RepID=UPI0018D10674|nr:SLATT domain-containing protein [Mycolicibacterium mengxianglii]